MVLVDAGGRILVGHRLGHDLPETSRMARRAHPTRIVPNRIGMPQASRVTDAPGKWEAELL
jgi:hypothetical protein